LPSGRGGCQIFLISLGGQIAVVSGSTSRVIIRQRGSGLRLMEAHRLRVKDLALNLGELIVRDAKGGKDHATVLPAAIIAPVR
jgi:integrase